MNSDLLKMVLGTAVRHGATVAGAWLVKQGIVDADGSTQFVGAVMCIAAVAWSLWNKYGQYVVASYLQKMTATASTAAAKAAAEQAPIKASTVAKILIAAFVLSAFLANVPSANAAGLKPLALTPVADPLNDLMSKIESIKTEAVAAIIADIQAADADAATLTSANDPASFRDPIAHACYPAQIKFLQSLPQAQPFTGKLVLVQLFQRKRDFVAQVKAGLPVYLKLGCAPLLGDEVQIFVQTMGLVGVKVLPAALTGLFPALAPITLPAMAALP
jgi:hypothetical protein